MKLLLLSLFSLLFFSSACTKAQSPRSKSVVILIPRTVSVESSLQREYDSLERDMAPTGEEENDPPGPEDGPGLRATKENMDAAARRSSFRNYISHMGQDFYLYALNDLNDMTGGEIAVYMEFDSSGGDMASLRATAEKYNCRFLVNFPDLRYHRNGTSPKAALHAQLYDAGSDAMLVDSLFQEREEESMLGGCKRGTLECAMIEAGAPFMMRSIEYIAQAFMGQGTE